MNSTSSFLCVDLRAHEEHQDRKSIMLSADELHTVNFVIVEVDGINKTYVAYVEPGSYAQRNRVLMGDEVIDFDGQDKDIIKLHRRRRESEKPQVGTASYRLSLKATRTEKVNEVVMAIIRKVSGAARRAQQKDMEGHDTGGAKARTT